MLPVLLAVLIGRMVSSRLSNVGEYSGGIFSQIMQQLNLNQDPVLNNDSSYVITAERFCNLDAEVVVTQGHRLTSGYARHMPPVVPRNVSQERLKDLLLADSSENSEATQEVLWKIWTQWFSNGFRTELEDISEWDALFEVLLMFLDIGPVKCRRKFSRSRF